MKLDLFYSPKAQSIVAQVALEEAGLEHTLHKVSIAEGLHRTPEYLARNPAGRVPTLLVDGKPLSETHAILSFIADAVPEKHLLPPVGSFARAQAHQWLSYLASIGHIAVRTVRRGASFSPDPVAMAALKSHGPSVVREVLALIENHLAQGSGPFFFGDTLGVVDCYLMFAHGWAGPDIYPDRADRPLIPHLDGHNAMMRQRPAVQRALAREAGSL